jgi:hypothetical protein
MRALGFFVRVGRVCGQLLTGRRRQLSREYQPSALHPDREGVSRRSEDGPRFAKATKGADGKHLTYRALTAKQ